MNGPRVLVVDDNPINIELATHVLENAGFVVAGASCAAEAMAQLSSWRPEVILMDIQMPVTDGLTLATRLKADPSTRHVVVIAFTAYAMKGDEAKMRSAGCDGYIPKPIDVATFAAEVGAHIRSAKAKA